MQEYAVTAAGETMHLQLPFTVFATQNPIEQEGTYPLPEAQLDRFMFSIYVVYPDKAEEVRIVEETTSRELPRVDAVFDRNEVLEMQELVRRVPVSRHVVEYAVSLCRGSRPNAADADKFVVNYIEWGAGPRASQNLVLAAKVRALLTGKPAPSCEDIRTVAHPVLAHRIIPNYNATGEGIKTARIIQHLIKTVREPSYKHDDHE